MKQYLDLVRTVFEQGSWQTNRTGIRTLSLPGASMRFDLSQGFPAVTTKKLAFKSAVGELVGFLRGYRSAAEFRALGCKVWDQNANENAAWLANPYRLGEDDLGPVYGVQWRNWPAFKALPASATGQIADALGRGYMRIADTADGQVVLYKAVDQLRQCLDTIVNNPSDRRIIFHGWNWAQLEEMALPPCHLLYQFLPNAGTREISLCLYIRSNDIGLGTPFNLTEGAALLHLVGRLTGFKAEMVQLLHRRRAHLREPCAHAAAAAHARAAAGAAAAAVGPHPGLCRHRPVPARMAGAGRAGRLQSARLPAPCAADGTDGGLSGRLSLPPSGLAIRPRPA